MSFKFPSARIADVVEIHHGVAVADPYRWLEDAESAETIAWVEAQNALTASALAGPVRDALVPKLTRLFNIPRTTVPFRRGGRYFFTHNTGLQNQGVFYVQDDPNAAPRVLIDPNALSADGTIALTGVAVSEDGALVAYALSHSGSDWQDIFIRDVATGRDLDDQVRWVKFASIAWVNDGSGFYYTRFPQPGTVPDGDENYFNRVCYHRLGEPQERDALVFDAPFERETVFNVEVSHDDRWAVITAFRGSSDKCEVYLVDRGAQESAPRPLFTGFTDAYAFVQECGGRLFFVTDHQAPRGRIVAVDPVADRAEAVEVVAESADKLSSASLIHRTLVAVYLSNASDRVRLFELSGAAAGEIELPGLGSLTGLTGRVEDDEVLLGFTSFTYPPTNFRFDFNTRRTERLDFRLKPEATGRLSVASGFSRKSESPEESAFPIDPEQYETEQVWYPSRDGTKVSMFLVRRKGLARDGRRPVLLSGYGGFNISLTPSFDPSIFVLLDAGGICAVANLRGGGEYGEEWHAAGMFEKKQNVFDDFIAAAEWLASSGWSCAEKIAIEGGSNGGLLTAAVMIQRPDLFGAVVCRVPVADMLRYHLFTVGRFWISEYGSADDPKQFPYLLAYSPYHNVEDGARYPPILITTADTDDRVSPGMAKKFAARLQSAAPPDATVLIRVETKAGHGAGKPISKVIEEDADIYSFVLSCLGVDA
ncbi:MAG TPA: prolyl oligopeptidase family serine peptidase [Vicinamibacterales bacterium]